MDTELPSLISITLAAVGAVAGLASFMLQTRFKSRVEAAAQRALVEFKHHLDSTAEEARFDYQRRISDFNRYAEKRHNSYAELWRLLRAAHGSILDLERRTDQGFEYFNEHDVEEHLAKKGIPSGKRNEVVETWRNDRTHGVHKLNELLASHTRHEAQVAFVAANNSFVENELYLSDAVNAGVRRCLHLLDSLQLFLSDKEHAGSAEAVLEKKETYDFFQQLRGVMRAELSSGGTDIGSKALPNQALMLRGDGLRLDFGKGE